MSNLRDLIRLEIELGQLAEPFRVSDLRALVDRSRGLLGGKAAPEHLNSYLANHSTGPGSRVGEAVKRGGARLFIKHEERGTYSLSGASRRGSNAVRRTRRPPKDAPIPEADVARARIGGSAMIDKRLAQMLLDGRNQYDYPAAYVGCTGKSPSDIQIGSLEATFNSGATSTTSLLLDAYHRGLLLSAAGSELQRLGAASAIYWGYITSNDPRARSRARQHLSKTNGGELGLAIQNACGDIKKGDYGAALGRLNGIAELNQMPFASKIIAFLSPDTAGVYDNRINSFLSDQAVSLCDPRFTPVPRYKGQMSAGRVASSANQLRYQIWCELLIRLRDHMNQLGPRWCWKATEPESQSWRAVDIERALFAFTKQSRSYQSQAAARLREYCSQ